MSHNFYYSPAPNSLSSALADELVVHKDNSRLPATTLSRKLRKMGYDFLSEGMALTEDCPDGYGGTIQRRIGVKMWSERLADLPEYIPEEGEDPPTPEKKVRKARGPRKGKGKATAEDDEDSEEEEDDDEARLRQQQTIDFALSCLASLTEMANADVATPELRAILSNALAKLAEESEELLELSKKEYNTLELAVEAVKAREAAAEEEEEDEDEDEGEDE